MRDGTIERATVYEDGTLDELVAEGFVHLEDMGRWFYLGVGDVQFRLYVEGRRVVLEPYWEPDLVNAAREITRDPERNLPPSGWRGIPFRVRRWMSEW